MLCFLRQIQKMIVCLIHHQKVTAEEQNYQNFQMENCSHFQTNYLPELLEFLEFLIQKPRMNLFQMDSY